jgi:hypothetical protein
MEKASDVKSPGSYGRPPPPESEARRLYLEDVLRLMTTLANSLDLVANFSFCPHPISIRWLLREAQFQWIANRGHSPGHSLVKLDLWGLVRPRG